MKNKIHAPRKSHRPISSFSSVAPYFYMPLYPRTARHAWTYIFTILRDFFILQHLQRFHITKRRVINVDTAIDEKIPFVPQRIFVYLSFVSFFVKPIDMLKRTLGLKRAAPYLCIYLKFLTSVYKNASSIYRYTMTTTTRPRYLKTRKFRTIHFLILTCFVFQVFMLQFLRVFTPGSDNSLKLVYFLRKRPMHILKK